MARLFDVRAYGATGDGFTDDTAAIQAAIDAAAAAGGGRVVLGAGTFRVSPDPAATGGCVLVKSGVVLQGLGASVTLIKLAEGVTEADGIVTAQGEGASVRRLGIDGNNPGASPGAVDGLVSGSATDLLINGVEVSNVNGNGFDLRSPGSTVTLRNSIAYSNGMNGIIADGLVGSVFEHNSAYANLADGYRLGGTLRLLDSDSYGNGGNGVHLLEGAASSMSGDDQVGNLLVEGGAFHENHKAGVYIDNVAGYRIADIESYANAAYGIHSEASKYGEIAYNRVHGNNYQTQGAEVWLTGVGAIPGLRAEYLNVHGNVVTGGVFGYSRYGILEGSGLGDNNRITDNVISQVQDGAVRGSINSAVTDNQPFIHLFGTEAGDQLTGTLARELLIGGAGNDRIRGGDNDDTLAGGAGRDHLRGDDGADTFRFNAITDSYRTATTSHADVIDNFEAWQDRFDFAQLGFTGLGDGHGSTLRLVYSAASDQTYLKSFETDIDGNRFELILSGNQGIQQSSFRPLLGGDSKDNTLTGGATGETLVGQRGADTLNGNGGEDRLIGGQGADRLSGGEGTDTFVYTALSDSLRGDNLLHRDVILDFDQEGNDSIDVSALGFTGLGNGYNHTLFLEYDRTRDEDVIKSFEADALGRHFEIAVFDINRGLLETDTAIIFAHPGGYNSQSMPDDTSLILLGAEAAAQKG